MKRKREKECDAPAIAVYTSTPEEARWRAAAVEQFISCSACRMNMTSRARDRRGLGRYPGAMRPASSMNRKASEKGSFWLGGAAVRPVHLWYASAASVGTCRVGGGGRCCGGGGGGLSSSQRRENPPSKDLYLPTNPLSTTPPNP